MNGETYIRSLVKLLDDEDPFISQTAYDKLLEVDASFLPLLCELKEGSVGLVKVLLDEICDRIKFKKYKEDVVAFFSNGVDLEKGAFLVARFAYSDVNFKKYSKMLDIMGAELKRRIFNKESFDDIIVAVNRFFFIENGFRGNSENYFDPDNSFINRVLDRRLGLPVTLSTVYILAGRRANLPVSGIGLPGHFVVRYESSGIEIYVDPYNGGKIMTRDECLKLISSLGYANPNDYLKPAKPDEIIVRMYQNLFVAYKTSGDFERANRIAEILNLIGKSNGC